MRIGRDWATGVPAESFQLQDINGDGKLDIRLRWQLDELRNGGILRGDYAVLQLWAGRAERNEYYGGEVPVVACQHYIWNVTCTLDQHQPHGNHVANQEFMAQSFAPLSYHIAGLGIFMPDCDGAGCEPVEITLSLYSRTPVGGEPGPHELIRSGKVMAHPGQWADVTWFDDLVKWIPRTAYLVIENAGPRGIVGSDQNPYPHGGAFVWREHEDGNSIWRGNIGDWEAVPNSDFMFRTWIMVP